MKVFEEGYLRAIKEYSSSKLCRIHTAAETDKWLKLPVSHHRVLSASALQGLPLMYKGLLVLTTSLPP